MISLGALETILEAFPEDRQAEKEDHSLIHIHQTAETWDLKALILLIFLKRFLVLEDLEAQEGQKREKVFTTNFMSSFLMQ